MAYITLNNDIKSRIDPAKLIQLTDDNRTGVVDQTVVDEIIADAEGTLESYLRTRYTLPVPATPKVRAICRDIAVFNLFGRRATSDEGVYKVKKAAHDEAIRFLKDVQAGKAALDVPATEETKTNPTSADEVLSGPSRPSAFSEEKLRNF